MKHPNAPVPIDHIPALVSNTVSTFERNDQCAIGSAYAVKRAENNGSVETVFKGGSRTPVENGEVPITRTLSNTLESAVSLLKYSDYHIALRFMQRRREAEEQGNTHIILNPQEKNVLKRMYGYKCKIERAIRTRSFPETFLLDENT